MALIGVYILVLHQRPELEPWHQVELEGEFGAEHAAEVQSLSDYRRLEDALFQELDQKVYATVPQSERRRFLRYSAGSLSDPRKFVPNWNRTTLWQHADPKGAALLLHGLSDSPYSMRALAEVLRDRGFTVLALRLPGHGTLPSGLLSTSQEDWMAAVRLAMRSLRAQTEPDTPLFIVGYSTGAALAVEYTLARLLGENLPAANGLVLLSPAIGVSPLAALAVWQSRLAQLPGLHKLAWTDLLPEYDPYKYNSFTVNAGDQIYRLTRRISGQLQRLGGRGPVAGMPPVLAFQSVADATVSAPAVLNALFRHLAPEGHELVGFDINRHADIEPFLAMPALEVRARLLDEPPLPVDFTLVTNASSSTDDVVALRRAAMSTQVEETPLQQAWPADVYSLSHVALPFSPSDPLYGSERTADSQSIFLGKVDLRGERGLLTVSADGLIRLRYNPFFSYLEARLNAFLRKQGVI
ncbi:MAG: alpha/beta fold hydrolase [Pseudomonadales bacterium]